MTDREEVIKGLEKVWDAFNHMEHDLYADYVYDALELLKEQEPRILTLDEVDEAGGIVYYERKGDGATAAYIYKANEDSYDITIMGRFVHQHEYRYDYGIGWRIWSDYPKDERAVKWDE